MSEPRVPNTPPAAPDEGDSAEARREYGRQLAMDGLLEMALRAPDANKEKSAASSQFIRPAQRVSKRRRISARRRTSSSWSVLPLALAACAALAAGIWIYQQPKPAESIATLNDLRGSATLDRNGKAINAEEKAALQPGDELRTGVGDSIAFEYLDGTTIILADETEVKVALAADGAKQLRLVRGSLMASIAKQPAGKPMVFTTAHAQAVVLGTKFILNEQTSGTRLDVEEGRVRLSAPTGANPVEVTTGNAALASATGSVALIDLQLQPTVAAIPPFGPREGRPFNDTSPWNLPIPENPVLDPNSAAIAKNLQSRAQVSLYKFAVPVYSANADTPIRKITTTLNWGKSPFANQPVRIPEHAKPNSGTNAAFVVVDWQARRTWEFYKFNWDGTDVKTGWGGTISIDGPGYGMTGAGTAGASMLAGLVRVHEIENGRIDHAITIASRYATKQVRVPGRASDGDYTGIGGLPVGARVQLDPTIDVTAIPGITRAEITIAKALQKYGAYCIGKTKQPILINFELAPDATDSTKTGKVYTENGLNSELEPLARIPWDKLRVLKVWNGQDKN